MEYTQYMADIIKEDNLFHINKYSKEQIDKFRLEEEKWESWLR